MADEIIIELKIEKESAEKSLKEVEGTAKTSGEKAGDKFSDGFAKETAGKIGASIKGQLVAALAGIGAAFLGKASIDAALEAEKSVNAFNNALARTGKFTADASTSFQNFATDIERSTGLSGESVLDVATQIQNLANLSTSELPRATKATLDLSAALGIDLNSASTLVGKAANGNIDTFGRYGIAIKKGKDSAETFANTLAVLEKRFGGASGEAINTFGGALLSLQNAFGNILEEFGKLTTNSPVLIAVIKEIGQILNDVANSVTNLASGGDFTGGIVKSAIAVSFFLNELVVKPLEVVFNLATFVFNAITTGVQTFVAGLAKGVSAIASLGNKVGVVSDKTLESINNFKDASAETLVAFTENTAKSFTAIGETGAADAIESTLVRIQAAANGAAGSLKTVGDNAVGALTNASLGAVTVSQGFSLALDGMKQAALDFAKVADENFKAAGKALFQFAGQGAGQAFAAFGRAVAKGENAIGAFLNSLLASFGQAAIQLGTQFILQGIAYTWAGLPNGPALIGAGAALATFGGVLSALGGGGGGAQPSTSTGAVGSGSTIPVTETQPITDEQLPRTEVNIVVQGNVLDRRESGLEIASVLQEYFDTNNGVLVRT
jgi:hypothetical protein